jgi:AraC-like DNA-binding protein
MEEQVDNPLAWLAPLRRRFQPSSSSGAGAGATVAFEAGNLQVLHLCARAHRLRLEQIEGRPVWLVGIIQRDGSAVLQQGAASPALLPGKLVMLTSAAPFDIEFAGEQPSRQTWLVLPAETLRGLCPDLTFEEAGVVPCDEPHVQMLAAITDFSQQLTGVRLAQAGPHIAHAVAHLLAAAVQGVAEAPVRTSLAAFHLSRIKQFVLANLHDPDLTVRKVSEALRISPSHIHRVFLNERQTFGEWLWDRRLDACRAALERSADSRLSISQIAFNHGFSNSSHFSRAFKARFGMSPSEARVPAQKSRSGF